MTPTELDRLEAIAKAATPGPWNYEAERYSAKCVIGIKPRDDRWIASFQPEFNGERNGLFLEAFNPQTALKLIWDLRKAMGALELYAEGKALRLKPEKEYLYADPADKVLWLQRSMSDYDDRITARTALSELNYTKGGGG